MKFTRMLVRASGLGAAIIALFAASGCGYGSRTVVSTGGNFSNASLNGTYVYEIRSFFATGLYREIGAFTADGAGHITAGSDDSSLNSGGLPINLTGSYQVLGDGTGSITFNNTALGTITFAITLESSSKIKLMEADPSIIAIGAAELQSSTVAPSGTFAFGLHQEAAAPSTSQSASEVGIFDISGGNVSGTFDENLGGSVNQFTITGGAFNTPNAMGRGTASLTDNGPFTTTLIYYVVNSGKLVLLVSNANAVGSGTAELQSGNVGNGLSGNYAFGSTGDDGTATSATATVGSFTASGGANGTINPYTFDVMQNNGTYSNGTDSGTYSASASGRVAVTLNSNSPLIFWLVSPSRAYFLIDDPNKVEDGTADLQTVNSFSASTMNGQYAMVMGGEDLRFLPSVVQDLSRVGVMIFSGSGNLSVAELANRSSSNGAQPPQGGGLRGSYQVGSATGRITGSVSNPSVPPLDLVMYAVSGSQAYAMQTDAGIVTAGTVSLQH